MDKSKDSGYRQKREEGLKDPWGGVSLDGKARTPAQKEQDSSPIHALIDKLTGKKK